ncbi:MAG: alpha/beta hydrolase [Caulobacteraceae bacterium]|nr:alpha/beta hydrolase [Caulobacteraceae bacterium]
MAALDFGPQDRPVDLVFSHANGFNGRTYLSILAPLAADFRILAIDMRGHGRTTLPTTGEARSSWNDLQHDLLAMLAAADIRQPVLAGHSMGATVSLLAAAEAPGAARELVLFEPVIRTDGSGVPEDSPLAQGALKRRSGFASREAAIASYAGRGAFKTWTGHMLADYVEDGFVDLPDGSVTLAATPEWEFLNFTRQGHDSMGALRRIACPVDIFKAEHNSTCGLDAEAVADLPQVSLTVCAGVTHFLPMERPDLVEAAIRKAMTR